MLKSCDDTQMYGYISQIVGYKIETTLYRTLIGTCIRPTHPYYFLERPLIGIVLFIAGMGL